MSDKRQTINRVIIFVALTWLILLLGPQIFGTRQQPPSSQTTATGGETAAATPTVQPSGAAVTPPGGAVQQQPGLTAGVDSIPAQPVESITVATPVASYTFTNRGATAVGLELQQYQSLSPDDGNVHLLRPGDALLRYYLRIGADTVVLDNRVFNSEVTRGGSGQVERIRYTTPLSAASPGTRVVIDYNIVPDSYVVRTNFALEGASVGQAYLLLQLPSGLRSEEADTTEDQRHFAVAYKPVREDAHPIPFAKVDPLELRIEPGPIAWAAVKSKYFIVGLLKPEGSGFAELQAIGGPRFGRAATHMQTVLLDDVSAGTSSFEIYAGPQAFDRLTAMGRDFQNSNPYGGFLQPLIQPFAYIVIQILLWLKKTTELNYGWVLVIFGVMVRLALWPLNQKAMRTSIRMQRLQPELQEVQKKYKGNPQKQQEEIMRVYRDHGMTPFSPLAGCLPMLIPMPVLFALFFVFQNTIEFRGVSFLWLPDISQKDPFYIVPLVMGGSMFLMSWLGARNTPQNPQAKMMMYVLPIMFTVLFLGFASGLNLYYAVQNIAALPQQWLIAREKGKASESDAKPGSKSGKPRGDGARDKYKRQPPPPSKGKASGGSGGTEAGDGGERTARK